MVNITGNDCLTPAESKAIEELRERTIHLLTPKLLEDDTLYYRFLKARDFNLKNAEELLRKHLSDRKIYGIEKIANGEYTPPEHMEEYFVISYIGHDKEGSTVRYVDVGGLDVKGIISMFTLKQFAQYVMSLIEKDTAHLREQSERLGKSITTYTYILDMDRLNLYTVTFKKALELLMEGLKIYQDNYPERIKNVFVVNASIYFTMAFALVKTVLAGPLLQKIQIFNRNECSETLLRNIDADVLPAFLGGRRIDTDGNPKCYHCINYGKPVPEELYLKKDRKTMCQEIGVKVLNVTRFASSEIMFYIYEPNTHIEWEFETKTKDIGFGLFYRDSLKENPKTEELIPKQRIDTELASETGLYNCEKVGTYIIVFDNSYSWIRSKEIYYRIRMIKPRDRKN